MTDLPLVDPTQMERLKEWGGEDLQKKMIELFLTHAAERLDQIREGVRTGVAGRAETGAHTLKSSAGNVGAHRVQNLAQEVETLAEAGKLDGVENLLPTLEEEFQAACTALGNLLGGDDE